EDPAEPSLKFSLLVRLGPRPGTHFDEHVVSGQASIGDNGNGRAQRPVARVAEDEPEKDLRPAGVNKALLRQINNLSDTDLANLLLAVERDIVVERLGRHEKSGDWDSAFVYRRAITSASAEQRFTALGRGAMKAH